MPKRPTLGDTSNGNPRDTAIRYMNMLSLVPADPRSISTRELTQKLCLYLLHLQ